jgi:hypothetical protein
MRMPAAIAFLLTAVTAMGQGLVFFNNRMLPEVDAPIVLVDPETGESFRPMGPDWEVEVVGGLADTPLEKLRPVQPPSIPFRAGVGAGYFMPRVITLPGVGPGEEASVAFYAVSKVAGVTARIPFGPYNVRLSPPTAPPPSVPLGPRPLTNAIPKEVLKLLNNPKPRIPGEPFYKGKPLSYWLAGLDEMFPGARPGRPELAPGLNAVAELGVPTVPFILQYPDTNGLRAGYIVRRAIGHLAFAGKSNEVDNIILQSLSSTNRMVRRNALEAMPCYAVREQIDTLLGMAGQETGDVRRVTLSTLVRCGASHTNLLPIWIEQLASPDVNEQVTALSGLRNLGPAAQSAVPMVREQLDRRGFANPMEAARALWAIEGSTNILPAIVAELEQARSWIQAMDAIRCLGEIGPAARTCVPLILKTVEQSTQHMGGMVPPPLRNVAVEALQKIDPGAELKLPPERDPRWAPERRVTPPPRVMPFG